MGRLSVCERLYDLLRGPSSGPDARSHCSEKSSGRPNNAIMRKPGPDSGAHFDCLWAADTAMRG
jgi:hypothetical protein